ncbi:uncharacterized protein DDB_G0289357-like isoform X2 [Dysidea avara]|uniref:uncharacterized protein DDB_G0289357-like isoform X2 n=1 Tax=Dysidea avara TaxID=196820 RepID=UPI00331EA8C3
MDHQYSRYVTFALFCCVLAGAKMIDGANPQPRTTEKHDGNSNGLVRLTRQANNGTDGGGTNSGESWLGENWYWLLVAMIAVFVLVLLACICCCYKQGHLRNDMGQIQLSSIKASLPSPNLTGFSSPVSNNVGDPESFHGNLVVSPGILSSEHTPVASPQLQFMSSLSNHQHQRSPRNSITGKYGRRKNHSPGNSSGSEETIRHVTGTPSVSSLASVSSTHNDRISRAQSFTGVGGQQQMQPSVARMSRRKSGSQVRIISLSRGGSSLSVTSTNSNSSTHSGNSNNSHHSLRSAGAYQTTDSPEHPFVAVDVQVHVNKEMTQREKNMYTAAVLAESAAKLAQSAANYEEEMLPSTKSYKNTRKTHRLYSTAPPISNTKPNGVNSPNRRSSPSRSLPISHIHFTSPPHKIPNGTVHTGEIPIGSLDNKNSNRNEQLLGGASDRLHSPSSSDDETMFQPKPPVPTSGGPPPGSFHRPQTNSSLERERRAKRSKTNCNGSTDEAKKKKRHLYQDPLTLQPPKDLAVVDTKDTPEIPVHLRNPNLPMENRVQLHNFSHSSSAELQPPNSHTTTKANQQQQQQPVTLNNNIRTTSTRTTVATSVSSIVSSTGQLKRAVSASSSLSSVNDELSQSYGHGLSNLRRQNSVPNISQSNTPSSHHISRPLSGTSLSQSGYAPSGGSTNTIDSVTNASHELESKPEDFVSNHHELLSNPLRNHLSKENSHHNYLTGGQFLTQAVHTSGTTTPSTKKASRSSTNGFSPHISSYSMHYSSNYAEMLGGRPSLTGLASAEV